MSDLLLGENMEQKLKKDGTVDKRSLRGVSFHDGMTLDPIKAKRVELMPCSPNAKHGRKTYKVFIFDCSDGCGREIRVSYGQLYKAKGKCPVCSSRKKPYQHILGFITAVARHRDIDVTLTYEELVEFTKIDECTYCGSKIEWEKWSTSKGYSKAYNLDRIDNTLGYSKENCVVCCTACNFIRQDKLTHEEMLVLRPGLSEIMRKRNLLKLTEYN